VEERDSNCWSLSRGCRLIFTEEKGLQSIRAVQTGHPFSPEDQRFESLCTATQSFSPMRPWLRRKRPGFRVVSREFSISRRSGTSPSYVGAASRLA